MPDRRTVRVETTGADQMTARVWESTAGVWQARAIAAEKRLADTRAALDTLQAEWDEEAQHGLRRAGANWYAEELRAARVIGGIA